MEPGYASGPMPPAMIYSPKNPWPEPMIAASLEIKRWCFANVPTLGAPSRDSIIGHYEVDAISRANDPESEADRVKGVWPVQKFISELKSSRADIYVVQRNDTLAEIASRFGCKIEDLQSWNGIEDRNLIQVGQVIRLAATAVTPPEPEAEVLAPSMYQAPRVDIEVVIDGTRLPLGDGEYAGYSSENNQDLYRRPIDLGNLGKGFVVVGVWRLPNA